MPRKEYRTATFISTMAQMIPTAYIVATGTVPTWARAALAAFTALWLLVVLAKGTAASR